MSMSVAGQLYFECQMVYNQINVNNVFDLKMKLVCTLKTRLRSNVYSAANYIWLKFERRTMKMSGVLGEIMLLVHTLLTLKWLLPSTKFVHSSYTVIKSSVEHKSLNYFMPNRFLILFLNYFSTFYTTRKINYLECSI